jgi:hypothetical protein
MTTLTTTMIEETDLGRLIGLADMEPQEQEELLSRIGELIMESVMIRAVAELTDDEAIALTSAINACANPEALTALLTARVPDIDSLIREESFAFRNECAELLTKTEHLTAS